MFLPNHLPNGVRQRNSSSIDGNNNNDEESQLRIEAVQKNKRKKMGGKGKKARAADRDEIIAGGSSSSPMGALHQQPSTSAESSPAAAGGFVARSWARISGRRRRQKRRMEAELRREVRLATTLTVVDGATTNGIGGAGGGGHQQQPQQGHRWSTGEFEGGEGANANANMSRGGGDHQTLGNFSAMAHLEEEEIGQRRRGMDRLRRSIRRSLHKGGSSQSGQVLTHSVSVDGQPSSSFSSSNGPSNGGHHHANSKSYCHSDEIAVRSAACSFPVKYLGTCEVFESRGMSVCESALQHLRTRKRAIKALLYVSGDGIRVVDQENNRGLIVDQTIEKVSFCSPDRHNEKGFAYICRDGATRRWMCHGFQAVKDSGERLSHAVGCAFTVCLEKKRKRDAESTAYKNAQVLANSLANNSQQKVLQGPLAGLEEITATNDEFSRTNQAYRSFRQLSISERRADPQKAILVEQPRPRLASSSLLVDSSNQNSTPINLSGLAATPRPSANPTLFERTGSLRVPINSAPPPIPGPKPAFNRFNSLQYGANARGNLPRTSMHNEPIWEGEDDVAEITMDQQGSGQQQQHNIAQGWPTIGTNGDNNHFYRTLPHSMPNFGQVNGGINNIGWSLSSVIPPTIPEEDNKQYQPPSNSNQQAVSQIQIDMDSSSSPPADPFTSIETPKVKADDWLEQTFKRASSHSSASTLPRSATTTASMNCQESWAKFPQSQSFHLAQDWPPPHQNGGAGPFSSVATTHVLHSSPPTQPPPPLWPQNQQQQQSMVNIQGNMPTNVQLASVLRAAPRPPITKLANPSPRQQDEMDKGQQSAPAGGIVMGAANKNHSRKASGNRRIEYQLLQETDVSLSPPKSSGTDSILARIGGIGGRQKAASQSTTIVPTAVDVDVDPFDVDWSQQVLEATAKQRQNGEQQVHQKVKDEEGGGGGREGEYPQPKQEEDSARNNPFGWDINSPAVNV